MKNDRTCFFEGWAFELDIFGLQFVKTTQLASEESKLAEVMKLQKALEKYNAECAAAKVAAENERTKYISIQGQLEYSLKEITNLRGSLAQMTEVKQKNSHLKVNLTS
jgi:hypothetical protein